METVIAIGVLAVLLTAFLAVFTPAAQGIRKAISVQEADRLTFTLERELATLRPNEADTYNTGFEKAFDWISSSHDSSQLILIYQYRGVPNQTRPSDGTLVPFTRTNGVAGQDFVVQPVVRRQNDTAALAEDLAALEGRVYAVTMTQLIFDANGQMVLGQPGALVDPAATLGGGTGPGGGGTAANYPAATIAFAANFFRVPNSSPNFIQNNLDLADLENPVFTRNLAVRR
jgi:hypothetical protein